MSRIPVPRSQSGTFHFPPAATDSHHHGSPLRQEAMSATSSPLPETRKKQSKRDEVSTVYITPSLPPERVSVGINRKSTTPSPLSPIPSEVLCLRTQLLMSPFLSRPFARKSSLSWLANAPSLRPVSPLARNVQLNQPPRKGLSLHFAPLLPLLFRRTSLSPKQASSVLPNERIASWSSMTKKA